MASMTGIEKAVHEFASNLEGALLAGAQAAAARLSATVAQIESDIARCRLLSKGQVREALNCSMRSVDKWMKDGSLPVVWLDRRPRFDPEDVRAFCQGRKLRALPGRRRRAA